ncbi:MAG: bacterial Ig-like domain-containing protein [Streptococcaceae bacterium]|nr:bacterial Ig-like domain-containing protein [Streptococcaceae bacterium]MCH4176482.1 bacterial Ig-like domain-containing protein [Streptococcaceae bacterium]
MKNKIIKYGILTVSAVGTFALLLNTEVKQAAAAEDTPSLSRGVVINAGDNVYIGKYRHPLASSSYSAHFPGTVGTREAAQTPILWKAKSTKTGASDNTALTFYSEHVLATGAWELNYYNDGHHPGAYDISEPFKWGNKVREGTDTYGGFEAIDRQISVASSLAWYDVSTTRYVNNSYIYLPYGTNETEGKNTYKLGTTTPNIVASESGLGMIAITRNVTKLSGGSQHLLGYFCGGTPSAANWSPGYGTTIPAYSSNSMFGYRPGTNISTNKIIFASPIVSSKQYAGQTQRLQYTTSPVNYYYDVHSDSTKKNYRLTIVNSTVAHPVIKGLEGFTYSDNDDTFMRTNTNRTYTTTTNVPSTSQLAYKIVDSAGNLVKYGEGVAGSKDLTISTGAANGYGAQAKGNYDLYIWVQETQASKTLGNITASDALVLDLLVRSADLTVKDSTIDKGSTWSPVDNFVAAYDKDGGTVNWSSGLITTSGTVNTAVPAVYPVTYTYTVEGEQIIRVANITVKNVAAINLKDCTLYVGDSWDATKNFVSATSAAGASLTASQMTVNSAAVNMNQVGDYQVSYTYDGITRYATVHVLENEAEINLATVSGNNVVLFVGDDYDPEDYFVSAKDKTGADLTYEDVTVTGADLVSTADVTPVDNPYQVTYAVDGASTTVNVHVLENQADIHLQKVDGNDAYLYVGETYNAQDYFLAAVSKAGLNVPYSQVTVTGADYVSTISPTIPGFPYQVTYSIPGASKTVNVHVLDNQAEINLANVDGNNVNLYVGDDYDPENYFVSAKDKKGTDVPFAEVIVEGANLVSTEAVTETPFAVTYKVDGASKTVYVNVLENQAEINLTHVDGQDITLKVGATYNAEYYFLSAKDKAGNNVPYNQVTVTGADLVSTAEVTTSPYLVTYSIPGASKTVRVWVTDDGNDDDNNGNGNGDDNGDGNGNGDNGGGGGTTNNNNDNNNNNNNNNTNTANGGDSDVDVDIDIDLDSLADALEAISNAFKDSMTELADIIKDLIENNQASNDNNNSQAFDTINELIDLIREMLENGNTGGNNSDDGSSSDSSSNNSNDDSSDNHSENNNSNDNSSDNHSENNNSNDNSSDNHSENTNNNEVNVSLDLGSMFEELGKIFENILNNHNNNDDNGSNNDDNGSSNNTNSSGGTGSSTNNNTNNTTNNSNNNSNNSSVTNASNNSGTQGNTGNNTNVIVGSGIPVNNQTDESTGDLLNQLTAGVNDVLIDPTTGAALSTGGNGGAISSDGLPATNEKNSWQLVVVGTVLILVLVAVTVHKKVNFEKHK